MNKNTFYKWQFLKRNLEYQVCYDFFSKFYKNNKIDSEDESQIYFEDEARESFMIESCNYFKINALIDYNDPECPEDLFLLEKINYHQLDRFSLKQLKDNDRPCNLLHEFESSLIGHFGYLKSNDQNLLTITIDISKPFSKDALLFFLNEIKSKNKLEIKGTKNIFKGLNSEQNIEALLVTFDEKEKGSTLQEIYKILKSKNLYSGPTDNINATISQLNKRAQELVKSSKDLELTIE